MDLIFATNNPHKLEEIAQILGNNYKIRGLAEMGITEDIPETEKTLEGNALLKARYIYKKTGKNCFADDTGLEIEALDNEPGVYSARYAGEPQDSEANMQKVLKKMQGTQNRKARFRTIIALILDGNETLFEGIVEGAIAETKMGEKGFGYDPIFVPKAYKVSFAEMGMDEKNKISHRGRAIKKLTQYLKEL